MTNVNEPDVKNGKVEIIDNLPFLKPVEGHFTLVPFLLTSEMFGGLDFEMVGKELSSMIGNPLSDMHVHVYPEIYLLVSVKPGEAKIEIETANGVRKMTSPAVAYIPANTQHRFLVLKASPGSFCFGVLLKKETKDLKKNSI